MTKTLPLLILLFIMSLFALGPTSLAQAPNEELGLDPSDFDKPGKPSSGDKKKPTEELGLDDSDFSSPGTKETPASSSVPSQKPEQPDKTEAQKEDTKAGQKEQANIKDSTPSGDGQKATAPVRVRTDGTTRYITISGAVGLYFVLRDDFFADAVLGNSSNNFNEEFFDPRVTLRIDAQMERNVRAVIELQNEERDEMLHRTSLGTLHVTGRGPVNNFRFEFEKAYLEIGNFLVDGLMIQSGIIPHKYSLRADGQSFFLDLRESESPFATRSDTHAIGALAHYRPIRALDFYVDAFYFITSESRFAKRDETIAGLNFDLNLSKDIRRESDEEEISLVRIFNLNFTSIQGDNNSPIWSFGGGFSYFIADSADIFYTLEFYGEMLLQFGKYSRKNLPPPFAQRDQTHLAFGSYTGVKWLYRHGSVKPFIDISCWYISGDDDDPNRSKNRDIVQYENIDSTLIVEDNDYGLDIDSNYWAIKCQVGSNLPIGAEEMRLALVYAHFQVLDAPSGITKHLGEEIDLRFTWEYTSDVVFSMAGGVLWDSKYLKRFFDEVGADGKGHTFLFRVETSLQF